jgi:hypothetical protein
MITTSLIKELEFISSYTNSPVFTSLKIGKVAEIGIKIEKSILELEYKSHTIWREGLSEVENFGVESCDTIYQIMEAIDKGEKWDKFPHDFVSS